VKASKSKEYIQEKILKDFQNAAKKFYEEIEEEYLNDLRDKMHDGTIDITNRSVSELSIEYAEQYQDYIKNSKKLEVFVKNYVNDTFDLICDSLSEDLIEQEEAEEAFLTLKHILVAGKIHLDEETQIKTKKTRRKRD
jgi:hypothetical protein